VLGKTANLQAEGHDHVRFADLVALVRAPAALSVPGDVLVGAAASGGGIGPRTLGLMGSSICLYWAGMALNDYADAAVDAVERPDRPIPSGRVPRRTALRIAVALTAAGLGLAAAAGGRRALVSTVPLACLVWAYDLGLKSTPFGPAAMAGTRVLDVLTGAVAAGQPARGALPALLVGVHTYTLTALSRHEISGGEARVPAATLTASVVTAGGAALSTGGRVERVVAGLGALAYLGTYGRAQVRAIREPTGRNMRRAVGAGIVGLVPLQAALTARAGAPVAAAALALLHPVARRLARRISPT
jgi:4-hydroxybenzoate polyprenyltransferase